MDFTNLQKNLEALGYTVSCFENKAQAREYLCAQIHDKTVGIGGSMTVEEMGLYEKLSGTNSVYWHWRLSDSMTPDDARALARTAEIYISSVNGLAQTGELINIDGYGNRVAETINGHKKVYFIVGNNKIASDYDSALFRARNIAGPLNAKRLNKKTPCAVNADKCYNCKSPDRICRALSVLWECPTGCEYEVVLVDEKLGY